MKEFPPLTATLPLLLYTWTAVGNAIASLFLLLCHKTKQSHGHLACEQPVDCCIIYILLWILLPLCVAFYATVLLCCSMPMPPLVVPPPLTLWHLLMPPSSAHPSPPWRRHSDGAMSMNLLDSLWQHSTSTLPSPRPLSKATWSNPQKPLFHQVCPTNHRASHFQCCVSQWQCLSTCNWQWWKDQFLLCSHDGAHWLALHGLNEQIFGNINHWQQWCPHCLWLWQQWHPPLKTHHSKAILEAYQMAHTWLCTARLHPKLQCLDIREEENTSMAIEQLNINNISFVLIWN